MTDNPTPPGELPEWLTLIDTRGVGLLVAINSDGTDTSVRAYGDVTREQAAVLMRSVADKFAADHGLTVVVVPPTEDDGEPTYRVEATR